MKTKILTFILISFIAFGFTTSLSTSNRLQIKADLAEAYCEKNGFNTDFCILIDMSIHSGKNRLFVYNFNSNTIVSEGLCAHGSCDNLPNAKVDPEFSNVHETHCSSLGKYKIGKRGYSNWGVHFNYKLHGLESTNSNAYARTIVLHSWEMMPDKETYPESIPYSWGCPMVSDSQMNALDKLLKPSKKPVLMWIFNS